MARLLKALVVGIDAYKHIAPLHGCVNDAFSVKSVLETNSNGTTNFSVEIMTGNGPDDITRASLKDKIQALFTGEGEVALLYFAGHGFIETTGGYIMASDSARGDEGVSINDILKFASDATGFHNRIIILDSCNSGIAGVSSARQSMSELADGVTIMTSCTAEQLAMEEGGNGVFTTLFVNAMNGAAANLVGEITPGSVYAHIDQSLGSWDHQRPVFKANVKRFVSLRTTQSPIELADLKRIVEFFPTPGYSFPLDPSFEPKRNPGEESLPVPDPNNAHIFSILQKMNRINLVTPVDAIHMYYAAMESKACRLTVLGEHYRRLVEKKRI